MAFVPVLLHCDHPAGNAPGVVVSNVSKVPRLPVGANRGSNSSSRKNTGCDRLLVFFIYSLRGAMQWGGSFACCAALRVLHWPPRETPKDLLILARSPSCGMWVA